MFTKPVLFFCLVLCNLAAFSQKVLVNVYMENKVAKPGSDTIYYDPGKPLTWKDFKGTPDPNHFGGAVTSSGFAFDADIKIEGRTIYLNVGVYAFFSKRGSWKKSSINSDYHLEHEQHHFDITRIGAENFIKALVKSTFTKDNYNKLLEAVFDKSFDESSAMQSLYDSQTRHSINSDQQQLWNEKIIEEIKKIYQ